MIVDVFIPCFIDQFYPGVAEATLRVLEHAGCGVNYNVEQTCCGQPAFNAGRFDDCKVVGEKFIREFSEDRYVVIPGASCTGMIRNYYPELFTNSLLHNQYTKLRKRVYELSEFLVHVLKVSDLGSRLDAKAVFHDSCSAVRELQLTNESRQLLSKVRGLELIELPEAELCCGFGGTFSVKYPQIASAMGADKLAAAKAVNAEVFISTDSSCLLHLQSLAAKQGGNVRFMHLAEVLASGLEK